MTLFVSLVVLATVLAIILLVRPYWRRGGSANVSRRQLNMTLLREQQERLNTDREENLIGEAQYQHALSEINRRLLEEASITDDVAVMGSPRSTVIALCVLIPLVASAMYWALGNPSAFSGSTNSAHTAQQAELDRMVSGLAEKLEKDPSNLQGWAMLARSYKYMGRLMEAEIAYERAGSIMDNDAQMLASYADTAASNAGGRFDGKPSQLIDKAMKVDPKNPMVLWLAGTAAFQRNDFDKAISLWEKLVQQLPPGSEDAQTLRDSIKEASEKAGKPYKAVNKAEVRRVDSGGVSGVVELDEKLIPKLGKSDTLMIIARVPGTRMPVAVIRTPASNKPVKFTIDDSNAMRPDAKISTEKEVEIEARISKSGLAQPESGDLISSVLKVKVGTRDAKVRVSSIRP